MVKRSDFYAGEQRSLRAVRTTIERRPPEGEPRRLKVCWCRVAPGLISEIPDHLRPFHIDFIEQKGGDWLVAFKAENILASLYVKMTGTEMASLLERAAQ